MVVFNADFVIPNLVFFISQPPAPLRCFFEMRFSIRENFFMNLKWLGGQSYIVGLNKAGIEIIHSGRGVQLYNFTWGGGETVINSNFE